MKKIILMILVLLILLFVAESVEVFQRSVDGNIDLIGETAN